MYSQGFCYVFMNIVLLKNAKYFIFYNLYYNVSMVGLIFKGAASGPSPMAALMSVADNLTSPEPISQPSNNPSPTSRSPPTTATNAQQRSASRGSQHSPNSSGNLLI
jgi:hypothetical protein